MHTKLVYSSLLPTSNFTLADLELTIEGLTKLNKVARADITFYFVPRYDLAGISWMLTATAPGPA